MEEASLIAHNIWMMVATALVFIMHLGFACVEAGFTQSKTRLIFFSKIRSLPLLGYCLML
jgi:Amt family ammonium transporter